MKNYGTLLALCSFVTYSNAQDYSVVERGPNHRVWRSTSETREADGRVTVITNSYTEIATGLCYEDRGAPGRWLDTREEFAIVREGATARFGGHQLTLAPNINAPRPVIAVGVDGQRFVSKPWGLVFHDRATGNQVLVAEVKDSEGMLTAPNVVLYPDAFTDCKAALRYTYTRAGCEQDVIFMDEGFGRPEDYGLPSETTVLEMWTEFVEAPAVQKIAHEVEDGLRDETLVFGKTRIQAGRAFVLNDAGNSIPVAKTWVKANGRSFLAEAVWYPRIRPLLDTLPAQAGGAKDPNAKRVAKVVKGAESMVAQFKAPAKEQLMAMAIRRVPDGVQSLSGPAVVLDYLSISGTQPGAYTFQGTETYYVTGPAYFQNTTTFQPGAVIKYAVGAFLDFSSTAIINFEGTAYRPVIFTGKDDNSVGQIIAGSTGNPAGTYYANGALRIWFNPSANYNLSNLRIRHAQLGMHLQYDGNAPNLLHIVRNAQFVNCQAGLAVHYSSATGVRLQNALFHNVNNVISGMYYGRVDGEHVTVNGASYLNYNPNNAVLILRNSLLVNVTTPGSYSGSGNAVETSGTVFQSGGDGMHYLAAGSLHRNPQGLAAISADLELELRKMTTYPPLTLASPVSVATTLSPQAARDTDALDRGYHYWPLDYIASQVAVSASLTLANGVALGVKGFNGLDVYATVSSEGTPSAYNRIVSCQNVQEQGGPGGGKIFMRVDNSSYFPAMRFRFTEFSIGQGVYGTILDGGSFPFQELTLRDCWVRYADWNVLPNSVFNVWIGLTNNIIERCSLSFQHYYYSQNTPLSVYLYNNLFRYGNVTFNYYSGSSNPTWHIKDNLFDQTSQTIAGTGTGFILKSHNGFTAGTTESLPGTGNKPNLVADYVSVPLGGSYYYPLTGSGFNTLRNAGSRTAASAGLYHHTVRADQAKAGESPTPPPPPTVSIGYHYVALDPNGKPHDTDRDGVPDYLEDVNGDGTYQPPTETPWEADMIFEGANLGLAGTMINLYKDAANHLRINSVANTAPLPFINAAHSARGTVARISVAPSPNPANPSTWSKIVGEYLTAPDTRGRNPSRTTVDRYGNVWVGNRDENGSDGGSVTCIGVVIGGTRGIKSGSTFIPDPVPLPGGQDPGQYLAPPFLYCTAVDRHGTTVGSQPDGLIKTSFGRTVSGAANTLPWANAGAVDSLGGVSTAEDEAIIHYTRVVALGPRTIAIDRDNNFWVGSHNSPNEWNEFVDASTGLPVTGRKLDFNAGGYGGVIDGFGNLWSPRSASLRLLRFTPAPGVPPAIAGGPLEGATDGYGIGVDPLTSDVWLPAHGSPKLYRFGAASCLNQITIPAPEANSAGAMRGLVVDARGNVWVACGNSPPETRDKVLHFRTTGEVVGQVSLSHPTSPNVLGLEPLGVSVDNRGMIWAICSVASTDSKTYAMRIDPDAGAVKVIGGQSYRVGEVVEAVDMGDAGPYNYSDMSGFVTLAATQPAGVWDFVHDSTVDNTLWTSLGSGTDTPGGTRAIVEVRAANQRSELSTWPFRAATASGVMPASTKGRYLEVRVNLLRDFGVVAQPVLRAMTLNWESTPGCTLQISGHPRNQALSAGQNALFTVQVIAPPGVTPTYQWLKNGTTIAGATAPNYTINNVQYSHADIYSVRVTAGAGCTLESRPARLHIKGNAPTVSQQPVSVSPSAGANVSLSARATITAAAGDTGATPVRYQWRLNQLPITGASGLCTQIASAWEAQLTLNNVQCANAGKYSVVFWNQYGESLSDDAVLSIQGTPPLAITPTSVSVENENQNVTLTAAVCIGGSPFSVQWYKGSGGTKVAIPGANQLSYSIPSPITCDELGTYTVAVVDSSCGSIPLEASRNVTTPATPTVTIVSKTVQFTPANIGSGEWMYQWESAPDGANYTPISGVTSGSYVLPNTYEFYRVTASRDDATATGHFYHYPDSGYIEATATENGTLAVTYGSQVTGIGPFTYQWDFFPLGGGQQGTGVTTSHYTTPAIDCTRYGTYRLKVTTSCGSFTEAYTQLRVADPIATVPTATIKFNPVGSGPWTYEWASSTDYGATYTAIPGENSASYPVPTEKAPTEDDFAYFRVTASSGSGAPATGYFFRYDGSEWYIKFTSTENATFDVKFAAQGKGVVGTGNWTYRWYLGLTDTGITDSDYTVTAIDCFQDRLQYRVRVTDACGRTQDNYTPEIRVDPPFVPSMGSTTVKFNPIQSGTWTYQWASSTVSGGPYTTIPSATSASYILPAQNANYDRYYRVMALRSGGGSASGFFYHNPYPYVQQTSTQNGAFEVKFTPRVVGVVGNGNWTYRWYFMPASGGDIDTGVTSSEYTIPAVACPARGYYRVHITEACGRPISEAWAELRVDNCP